MMISIPFRIECKALVVLNGIRTYDAIIVFQQNAEEGVKCLRYIHSLNKQINFSFELCRQSRGSSNLNSISAGC